MPFDIIGAKQAGYKDNEIAQAMSEEYGFDYAAASKAGYSDQAIIGEMLSKSDAGNKQTTPVAPSQPELRVGKKPSIIDEAFQGLKEFLHISPDPEEATARASNALAYAKMFDMEPAIAYDYHDEISSHVIKKGGDVPFKKPTKMKGSVAERVTGGAKAGWEGSAFGMVANHKVPEPFEDLDQVARFSNMATQMIADLPVFLTGYLISGANPVTGMAGGFGMAAGTRQMLVDKYTKGDIKSLPELVDRSYSAAKATLKGELVGAITGATGQSMSTLATKLAAESAAMTVASNALEGRVPTAQDFWDNTVLLGVMHMGTKGIDVAKPLLERIYVKTGKTPEEAAKGIVDELPPEKRFAATEEDIKKAADTYEQKEVAKMPPEIKEAETTQEGVTTNGQKEGRGQEVLNTQSEGGISTPSPEPKVQPQGEFGSRGVESGDTVRGLALSTEASALAKEIIKKQGELGELPTYDVRGTEEPAKFAAKFVTDTPDQAWSVIRGESRPPRDLYVGEVYNAIKLKAEMDGDLKTIEELINTPYIMSFATEAGRQVKAFDSQSDNISPVDTAKQISKERVELAAKTGKQAATPKRISELEAKLKETEDRLQAYMEKAATDAAENTVKKLTIESRKAKRQATREQLDTEFKDLTVQLNKILNPNQLNVGIDPSAIPILVKMAKNRVESGITRLADVVDSIYEEVSKVFPITKEDIRDAIAQGEEKRVKAYESRLKNETRKINEQLETGNLAKPERQPIKLDAEGNRLKSERDQAKDALRAAMSKGGISKAELAALVELSKAVNTAKAAAENGGDWLEYGAAKRAYENYVGFLQGNEAPLREMLGNQIDEYKQTYNENPTRAAFDMAQGIIYTINKNMITLKSSFDLSFNFRQGLKVLMTHPTVWYPAFKKSFVDFGKTLAKRDVEDVLWAEIYSRENYRNGAYKKAGVLSKIEEPFPAAEVERLPVVGRVIKASDIAYTAESLTMRTGVFDLLYDMAKSNGVDGDPVIRDIGRLSNSLGGKGKWGKKGAPDIVKLLIWSPGMIKANIDLLTMHSFGAGLETGWAKKQAAINLLKVVGQTAIIVGVANAILPGSAETDPRSSDSGKVKVNNTRFDYTGGAASLVTLGARLAPLAVGERGVKKSSDTGLYSEYGSDFGDTSEWVAFMNFLTGKASPPAAFIISMLKGKQFGQKDFSWKSATVETFTPISVQNAIEAGDNTSADKVVGVLFDVLGINANTYLYNSLQKRDVTERLRQGMTLTKEQQAFYDSMPPEKQLEIDKESFLTAKEAAFSKMKTDDMIFAWKYMNDSDRENLRLIFDKRIRSVRHDNLHNRDKLDELDKKLKDAENRQ